jgi:hypothetical protein
MFCCIAGMSFIPYARRQDVTSKIFRLSTFFFGIFLRHLQIENCDAWRLRQLMTHSLLRGAFRPSDAVHETFLLFSPRIARLKKWEYYPCRGAEGGRC